MSELKPMMKWPFLLGDALLLLLAYWIQSQVGQNFDTGIALVLFGCVGAGALLAVHPFIHDHRAMLRQQETGALVSAAEKISELHRVTDSITAASTQWQAVQDGATHIAKTSAEMVQRMDVSAKDFMEFMKQSNDAEKAHLRLAVEKLKRTEGEWIEIVVAMLDQTFMLHLAAVRSGKPGVSDNIGKFQQACRDIARRTGVVLHESAIGSVFDSAKHRLADDSVPVSGSVVQEVLAPGVSFQGQFIRPELVSVSAPAPAV